MSRRVTSTKREEGKHPENAEKGSRREEEIGDVGGTGGRDGVSTPKRVLYDPVLCPFYHKSIVPSK